MTVANWNSTATCDPARELAPTSLAELIAIVKNTHATPCPSPVRAVGSLHSLNHCFTTTGTLVHMKAAPFRQIDEPGAGSVTVGAGVTMFELQRFLKERGRQIAVTPEIGNATAGSVACCGTKDASLKDGPGQISSTVIGVKMIDATGATVTVTEASDPARLRLIRSSYGLFGIVYEVTFATCPLQMVEYRATELAVPGPSLDEVRGGADGFLAFLFPYNRTLVVERRTIRDDTPHVLDGLKCKARNHLWKTGGHPFSEAPEAFAKEFGLFFPFLHFLSLRVDVMIDFQPGRDHFFDFGFWAFPASRWAAVVPAYLEFCNSFRDRTRFRPALPTEVYFIKQDDRALLSFSPTEDIFTLDMVHTVHRPAAADEETWDEMNRQFNAFAVQHGARPLLNQTKQLSRPVVKAALGADWTMFAAEREKVDGAGRFLSQYFADLL